MHKESFIINCNTLLHGSTMLRHLQGELFVIGTLDCTLYLSENVLLTVYCVVFGGVNSLRSGPEFTPPVHSTQSTAHSHSNIKCNLSVTIKKFLPEDDPAGSKHVQVCYN
jgi:hypothetical protein